MNLDLTCKVVCVRSNFVLETDIYRYLKRKLTSDGYRYVRVDTKDKIGFPDILAMRREEYCLIEAKLLRKKKLTTIEEDVKWQYGQLGFAVRALSIDLSYLIAIGKDDKLALIGKEPTICKVIESLQC